MSTKDRFRLHLCCIDCGTEGTADAEEEDGWSFVRGHQSTKVTNVSESFTFTGGASGQTRPTFKCNACGSTNVRV
jgi:hypothetical protein